MSINVVKMVPSCNSIPQQMVLQCRQSADADIESKNESMNGLSWKACNFQSKH